MRKVFFLSLALMLAGCATRPTGLARAPEMPALPPSLAEPAKRLPALSDPSLRGVMVSGADDDARYNRVAERLNAIIAAWGCVRETLRDGRKPEGCFKGQ